HSPDRLQIRQTGSEEDIRSGLLKCLKSADGFVQAWISEEEIVRSSGQHERNRQRASGFRSCGDSLYGEFEFIERLAGVSGSVLIVQPTSPASAARRTLSATASGRSPNP